MELNGRSGILRKNRFDGTANITAKIIFIDENHQTNANAITGFKLKTMLFKSHQSVFLLPWIVQNQFSKVFSFDL
jgi:hypothetical protein